MSERSVKVKVKRLHEYAVVPWYAHSGDSGFDLVAVEDVIVEPGQTVKVPTGLAFEIPSGYEMQIRPRSGVTIKTKLRVQLGTIDAGFRGEVSVMVDNVATTQLEMHYNPLAVDTKSQLFLRTWYGLTYDIKNEDVRSVYGRYPDGSYIIRKGDRIAQAVIAPVIHAELVETDELDDSERGDGGFGSTGVAEK